MIYYKENYMNDVNKDNAENLDFKDWIVQYSDDKDDNLKKWVKFKSGDYPDPDCVLKQNAPNCAAVKLGWFDEKEETDKYYIDCIFSFATFFKAFLRLYSMDDDKYYMPYLGQVYENYEYLFSDDYKEKFCKKQNIEKSILDELFERLNRFACNTHTLGNYMPCPDDEYNKAKGDYYKYKDRLEKIYIDIKDTSKCEHKWFYWFESRKDDLMLADILDNEELLKFKFDDKEMSREDIEAYSDYVGVVNDIIENRGKALAERLKKLA